MRKIFSLLFTSVILFSSCTVTHNRSSNQSVTINSLKYIGEYIVPFNQQFKETAIGGLSGIDYDAKKNRYYIISDDRSQTNPARFYTAKIYFTENGISNVEFVNVTTLTQSNGEAYPSSKTDPAHSPDPEALRYNPVTNQFVWLSEGERVVKKEIVIQQPGITIINKEGNQVDTFSLPPQIKYYETEKGLRRNSAFEGLSFTDNFKKMYVSIEEPLYEDGPQASLLQSNAYTRIIKYNVKNRKPIAQYAYKLEAVAHAPIPADQFMINGIPDILAIGKNKLLVIERSFSTGRPASTIRVYITDLTTATNISNLKSLTKQSFKSPASKKLLINMDDLGIYIDNIEGVTFGPDLPNGHKTLIFVSDNNFSKDQKTQFLLFEVL